MSYTRPHRRGRRPRRGLAPLEFVLALPILLIAAALIFKMGEGFLNKFAVNVVARQKATKNEALQSPEPAPFQQNSVLMALGPTAGTYGLVQQPADKKMRLNPIWPRTDTVTARFTVLFGSGDYRSIPFPSRDATDPYDPRVWSLALAGTIPPSLLATKKAPELDPSGFDNPGNPLTQIRDHLTDSLKQQAKVDEVKKYLKNPEKALEDILTGALSLPETLIKLLKNPSQITDALDTLTNVGKGIDTGKELIKVLESVIREQPSDDDL